MANRSTQSEYIWWYQGVKWTIIMHPRCNEWHTASMSIYWRLHSRLVYSFNDECPPAINVHWEAHGRYNEPLVSKSNAFLDFVQLAGQLHKCRASISGVATQNCQLQYINWINWTLLSCACSRITAEGTCSNSRWGTVSKADDQWMYWCPAPVGCIIIIIGINLEFMGYHMDECCSCELWIECDIVGNTSQKVMTVKGYMHVQWEPINSLTNIASTTEWSPG